MPETPTPILVYNRIDANRQKTRLLLTLFGVALLPVVSGIAAFFIVPRIYLMWASARPDALALLQAQLDAVQPADGTIDLLDLPTSILWLYASLNLVSTLIVTLAFVATTAFFIYLYGSRVILRLAHARPVNRGQERDLVQVVENLCIGAGLPLPRIHVIESTAPFATGRNPHDASLVVTRGLLELLDRRELEGVIAHELSHIGNHDIGLGLTLAALVATLSLLLRMLSFPRIAFRQHWALGVIVTVPFLPMLFGLLVVFALGISGGPSHGRPSVFRLWDVYALIAPLYAVFVAPVVALLIRQAVWRQREFLADADAALLTRNPEGLALALVKIGAAGGDRLPVGEGTVHLYFVDPRSKGSCLRILFPSHPSLEKRIALHARMGDGIAPSAIQAAREAGARVQPTTSGLEEADAPLPIEGVPLRSVAARPSNRGLHRSGRAGPQCDETASSTETADPTRTSDDGFMPLYDRPDAGSQVVALIPEEAVVKLDGKEGEFVRVISEGGVAGWVRSSPLEVQSIADVDDTLIPLYEQPDEWSRVLAQLPKNAVVTAIASEGPFFQVTTADHQVGYVSRSAPLTAVKNFQQ